MPVMQMMRVVLMTHAMLRTLSAFFWWRSAARLRASKNEVFHPKAETLVSHCLTLCRLKLFFSLFSFSDASLRVSKKNCILSLSVFSTKASTRISEPAMHSSVSPACFDCHWARGFRSPSVFRCSFPMQRNYGNQLDEFTAAVLNNCIWL